MWFFLGTDFLSPFTSVSYLSVRIPIAVVAPLEGAHSNTFQALLDASHAGTVGVVRYTPYTFNFESFTIDTR